MGKGVGERIKEEELKKKNQEIAELSASLSEGEPEGAKMPFFLPRKHSVKNYYEDSDSCVCAKQFVSQFTLSNVDSFGGMRSGRSVALKRLEMGLEVLNAPMDFEENDRLLVGLHGEMGDIVRVWTIRPGVRVLEAIRKRRKRNEVGFILQKRVA